MADPKCPGCKRSGCHCSVCNGTGRSRGRGYTMACEHCASIYRSDIEAQLSQAQAEIAALRELVAAQEPFISAMLSSALYIRPGIIATLDAARAKLKETTG